MQNEKELLAQVRSILDKHEKRPFDCIKKAIEEKQESEESSSPTVPHTAFLPIWGRFMPVAAACLVFLACIGAVLYASGGLHWMGAETAQFSAPELSTVESMGETETYMNEFFTQGAPPPASSDKESQNPLCGGDSDGTLSKDIANQRIDPALLADMERHSDDPARLYAVTLTPASSTPAAIESASSNDRDTSSSSLLLTATEIYARAAEGMMVCSASTDYTVSR